MLDIVNEEKTLKKDMKIGKGREEVSLGGVEDGVAVAYTLSDPLAFFFGPFPPFFLTTLDL